MKNIPNGQAKNIKNGKTVNMISGLMNTIDFNKQDISIFIDDAMQNYAGDIGRFKLHF
jgi:hypothetical protein